MMIDCYDSRLQIFILRIFCIIVGMQVNGTSNCNCWDGSETNIPSTMLLGQQTPQEMLNPFTGV